MENKSKWLPGTPLYCIDQWAIARTNQVLLTALLSASGNSFSFDNATLEGKIMHIYIGVNGDALDLYTIPAEKDVDGSISNSSLHKVTISPNKKSLETSAGDSSNRKELIAAINNWIDPINVAAWISQNFSGLEAENHILQTFIVNTSDFMQDHNYDGYFALKITQGEKGPVYTIDLVVVNTDTGEILNLVESAEGTHFRDLARLVPPFGQAAHPSTDPGNFGVLKMLGVQ